MVRRGPRYQLTPAQGYAPWLQDIHRALLPALGADALGRTARMLLGASRAPRTYGNYGPKVRLFLAFCQQEGLRLDGIGPAQMVRYVAFLGQRGTIAATSLRPYLAAPRALYTDLGLPPPDADSRWVAQAISGLRAHQRDTDPPRSRRHPLPAWLVYDALQTAEAILAPPPPAGATTRSRSAARAAGLAQPAVARTELELARSCLALVVGFLFFHRGGYTPRVTVQQLLVHREGAAGEVQLVHIPSGTKTARLTSLADTATRFYPGSGFTTPHPRAEGLAGVDLCSLLERFSALRGAAPAASEQAFWALPEEDSSTWSGRTFNGWLQQVAAHCGAAPPEGGAWSGHSVRKGAATAAAAVGVPERTIAYMGTWAVHSTTLARDYIDPSVGPSRAAWFFFGRLTATAPA